MQPKLNEFFAHFEASHTESAGGLRLVPLSQSDGLRKELRFEIAYHFVVSVFDLTAYTRHVDTVFERLRSLVRKEEPIHA